MAQQGIGRKCKRLRRALGFVPEVYGESTGGLIARLKALRDIPRRPSGRRRRNLAGTAHYDDRPAPPHGAFPMRVYAERYRREAAELRSKVLQSTPLRTSNKGKSWKDFEKAMRSKARNPKKAAR